MRTTMTRRQIWRLDRQAVGYTAMGTALYAAFSLVPNPVDLPGAHNLNFRPGVVVPILFGVLFGPIVGFLVGTVGTLISDVLTFGVSWNWEIGNGLIGLVAGLAPVAVAGAARRWRGISAAIIIGALAIIVGIGFAALTDIWVANMTPDMAIGVEWISVAKWDLAWGVPLTIVLFLAWERWRQRSAR